MWDGQGQLFFEHRRSSNITTNMQRDVCTSSHMNPIPYFTPGSPPDFVVRSTGRCNDEHPSCCESRRLRALCRSVPLATSRPPKREAIELCMRSAATGEMSLGIEKRMSSVFAGRGKAQGAAGKSKGLRLKRFVSCLAFRFFRTRQKPEPTLAVSK